jgi:hypothetical protein
MYYIYHTLCICWFSYVTDVIEKRSITLHKKWAITVFIRELFRIDSSYLPLQRSVSITAWDSGLKKKSDSKSQPRGGKRKEAVSI